MWTVSDDEARGHRHIQNVDSPNGIQFIHIYHFKSRNGDNVDLTTRYLIPDRHAKTCFV
jgi:hypothetical protein